MSPLLRIRRFFNRWIDRLSGIEPRRQARAQDLFETLVDLHDKGEPWVKDGVWNWSEGRPVDLVFPHQNLIILVHGPAVGTWEAARERGASEDRWRVDNDYAVRVRHLCRKTGAALLEFPWDASLDRESVHTALLRCRGTNAS